MAAFVIPISSDSSEECVVAPEVGAVSVTSPAEVLDLVDYSSSSDSDPSKDSLPLASEDPRGRSLFAMVSRGRDMVASRPSLPSGSSSHDTLAPSSEFPIALVVALSGIRRWPSILIRPGEAIPFGRPYHTYLNGPHKLLIARKRVGPFPARRLAWRRVSYHSSDRHSSPDFTSDSSSSGSSLDSSLDTSTGLPSDLLSNTSSVHSSGFDASGQSHLGPSTRVASSRLVYPPVMTPRYSEEFETTQRYLEVGQLMASGDRAGLTDRIRRRSFVRFVRIVMMLEEDLGDWSHFLRGVWDSALSLVVPWLCRTLD
uniref:Uncharacterized protein n=1 Tax=Tanacetum cinerariifolium TaxID=118510 RepID=A0A6L2MT54_TANCI|nr:hypothetical protein [Tanacetum cinerariifolium]